MGREGRVGRGRDGAGGAGGGWCGVGVPGPHTMHKLPIERRSPSRGIWRTPHVHHMPRPAGVGRNGRFCRATAAPGERWPFGARCRRAGRPRAGSRRHDESAPRLVASAPGLRRVRSPAPSSSLPGSREFASRARRVRFPAPSSPFPGSVESRPGYGESVSRLRRVLPGTARSLSRSRKDPRPNRGESGRRGLQIGVHCAGQPIAVAAQAQAAPRHIRGGPRAGSVRAERPCTGHHCRVLS